MDGFQLIEAKKAQLVGLDVARALPFVFPSGLGLVARALGENDVIVADLLRGQALRIRRDLLVADDRIRGRKRGDDVRVAAFEVPEVMQFPAGEDDEAAVLGAGILASLFLADERILVLGFGLQDDEREALGVEQKEVDETSFGLFEVLAQCVQVRRLDRDARLQPNVGSRVAFRKETPASRFEQLVDLDAGCRFLHFFLQSVAVSVARRPFD